MVRCAVDDHPRHCSSVERTSALLCASELPSFWTFAVTFLHILMHINLTVLGLTNIWLLSRFIVALLSIILHWEHIQSLVFLFCNFHTQTGYYTKCTRHLVANFLSYDSTIYYTHISTTDWVIIKIKWWTSFETQHIINTKRISNRGINLLLN